MTAHDPLQEAGYLLMFHAGAEVWPETDLERRRLVRRARSAVHPDRVGDRHLWDQVEDAATLLGLGQRGDRP